MLYAWDANDLTNTIYESDTNAHATTSGPANKFSIPVVTNGKVYVAAQKEVDVYGLLNGQPTAAAPVINPNGGTFSTAQKRYAVLFHPIRRDLLHSRWISSDPCLHGVRGRHHHQHRHDPQGDRERARLCPEQCKHCHVQLLFTNRAGDLLSGRRNLRVCADRHFV